MYEKMYSTLFNAITDALNLLDDGDFTAARLHLMEAQIRAEELYISTEAKPPLEIRLLTNHPPGV